MDRIVDKCKRSHLLCGLNITGSRLLLIALAAVLFGGCSSGSGKTGAENPPPLPTTETPRIVYDGPDPASADVQNFKINVWDNLVDPGRCGACHTEDHTPRFTRTDDINKAYEAILPFVNLAKPDESPMVVKVAGGHNCWRQASSFCADQIGTWIRKWVFDTGEVALTETALKVPLPLDVSSSLTFPTDTASFAQHVYPLLRQYCADCHRADALQSPVQPYLASGDVAVAYAAAQTKMLFNVLKDGTRDASRSRLVVRLREEAHNCWDNNCAAAGATMEAALEAFAATMEVRELDTTLLASKAMRIEDGTAISQGGRVENNAIALYNFKEGKGTQANDYSIGFPPELTLNLIGDVEWVSNWGVRFNNGRLLGNVETSRKLHRYISETGEYSIEAWVVPADITQEGPARIINYAGKENSRNFMLGQTGQSYDFANRSTTTNANGAPVLSSDDGDLLATQQHVVATYDAINGRRLYVNGERVNTDSLAAGNISQWDPTFALVLGNETDGQYPWRGTIRLLAIHNRALKEEQIKINYGVGVGQKILLAFSVSDLIDGMDDAYIVFQVEQFDDYSYLFNRPYFYSFTETPPRDIEIEGLRIGINGREAKVGQSFANLKVTLRKDDYDPEKGIPLLGTSEFGAVVEAEQGPELDQFFLSFDRIDKLSRDRVEEPAPPPPEPADLEPQPRVGVRTFAEINASLSAMTGIPVTHAGVAKTYDTVKQQMPPTENIKSFLVAHQMGITQLAVKYCNVLATELSGRQAFFPGFAGTFDDDDRDALINPLLKALLAHHIVAENTELEDQPYEVDSRERLNELIDTMTASCPAQGCSEEVVSNTITAVCAAALGSAVMLVQ